MNVAGVLLLRFIGSLEHSAEAQAAYAVGYAELFSLITWTSVGSDGRGRRGRRAEPRRRPSRARDARRCRSRRGSGWASRPRSARCSCSSPSSCSRSSASTDPIVVGIGRQLLRYLSVSGFFITVALTYTGGLQGTGDTRSPLYITLVSQVLCRSGICATLQSTGHARRRGRLDGHPRRPLHPLRAVGATLPPGQVAAHRGRILLTADPAVASVCSGSGAHDRCLRSGADHEMDAW